MFAIVCAFVFAIDLAVFINKISAFVLVCMRMIHEAVPHLIAIVTVLLMTSSALSCLSQDVGDFRYIWNGLVSLWEHIVGLLSTSVYADLRYG